VICFVYFVILVCLGIRTRFKSLGTRAALRAASGGAGECSAVWCVTNMSLATRVPVPDLIPFASQGFHRRLQHTTRHGPTACPEPPALEPRQRVRPSVRALRSVCAAPHTVCHQWQQRCSSCCSCARSSQAQSWSAACAVVR
jgi:hypothetical protein